MQAEQSNNLSKELLADQYWRLNNLYFIKDKTGKQVRFQMNWAQKALWDGMWYCNIILKARQLGMTTFIQIFFLDCCLFRDNTTAGVIAHKLVDAESFFNDKIKFAYDHLPQEIKDMRPCTLDNTKELSFSNGSSIRVGTSMRSGTVQYLHVSEFGKMCADFSKKAKEVITGALNAVAAGQFVFIESTAEGEGEFKDMFNDAWHNNQGKLSPIDYRAFFFPWWKHSEYQLEGIVPQISDSLKEYFEELEKTEGITLTTAQKAWYVAKEKTQRDEMQQEYPATPEEAFSKLVEGVILAESLKLMRKEGRICRLPTRRVPVNTFWDLGLDDHTSIFFHQDNDPWQDFIYYYEYRNVDISWYAKVLSNLAKENGWVYGTHYLPHDGSKRQDTGLGYLEKKCDMLQRLVADKVTLVPRIAIKNDGIEMLRGSMSAYRLDSVGCADGIKHLENYMWTKDKEADINGKTVFRKTPKENGSQHAADAIRQHAQGYRGPLSTFGAQLDNHTQPQRAYMRGKSNALTNPDTAHIL